MSDETTSQPLPKPQAEPTVANLISNNARPREFVVKPRLWAALARAQTEIENVSKNKTVKVRMKSGGEYTYEYATLDAVLDSIRKPLAKNELSVVQFLIQTAPGKMSLRTTIGHSSGEELNSDMPIVVESDGDRMRPMQSLGSAITFARRYSLQNMFMLSADDDDDGNDGQAQVAPRPRAAPAVKSRPTQPHNDPSLEVPQSTEPKNLDEQLIPFGGAQVKGKKLKDVPLEVLQKEWEYWVANAKNDNTKRWTSVLETYLNQKLK